MTYKLLAAAAIGFLSLSAVAQQTADVERATSCLNEIEVRVLQSQVEVGVEAYSAAWIPVEVYVPEDGFGCPDEVIVGSGHGLNWMLDSGMQQLDVEPYSARREPLHIAPSGEGWLLKLPRQARQHTFWLRVMNPSQSTPGGYVGYIELRHNGFSQTAVTGMALSSTQFTYLVEPSVAMSFDSSWSGGGSTYFNVDMGVLTAGSVQEFDLVLQSNTDVDIEVTSSNQGRLRHEQSDQHSIPYEFQIAQQLIHLSSPAVVPLNFIGNYTNWRVPLKISVSPVERTMLAGNYVDTIYFDVFPRQ